MKKTFSLFLILLVLGACSDKKVDTTFIQKEMKAREVKVVPEAKILQTAMSIGNRIAKELQNIPFGEHTNTGLIEYNEPVQQKLLLEDISIRALSFESETQSMHEKERQLLEAYLYNIENGLPLEANVQQLNEGETLLYTVPLVREGSPLGMWSVKIPRKTVVLSIED